MNGNLSRRLSWVAATVANGLERRARALSYRLVNRANFSNLQIHESMLADSARIEAYAAALPRAVRRSETTTIDVGTGTGVLAFLAARAGAREVHAVDHSAIIDVARRLAAANGLQNITFHQKDVLDLELAHRVDLIVHEQMGHYLFEERMVSNLAAVRRRLLVPGGRILPARFQFFIEPVEVKDNFLVPFIWEQRICGLDYSSLRSQTDFAVPPDYRRTLLKPYAYRSLLADPVPVLEIDLEHTTHDDLPRRLAGVRTITTAGRFDGLCVYFKAWLDGETVIDTSPLVHENTNWSVPLLRVENRREVRPGVRLAYALDADDLESPDSWRWSVTFE